MPQYLVKYFLLDVIQMLQRKGLNQSSKIYLGDLVYIVLFYRLKLYINSLKLLRSFFLLFLFIYFYFGCIACGTLVPSYGLNPVHSNESTES